jgi:signal transduction histidine kinase
MAFGLVSPVVSELGIQKGIDNWLKKEVTEKHGLQTAFYGKEKPLFLEKDVETVLFRSVKELLVNTVKHAQAARVSVTVEQAGGQVLISVEDDGAGFDPSKLDQEDATPGFGLFSIRLRLQEIGGTLDIVSYPNQGSRVQLTAPLKPVVGQSAGQGSQDRASPMLDRFRPD